MTDYKMLAEQTEDFLQTEPFYTAALSNISALLMEMMQDLNWAGFYLMREGKLTVGPFQGKPACIHIPVGKGVCGTSAALDQTIVVPDVHAFPGHIACDSASNSEIVVPIHSGKEVVGVLDIDSPCYERFSEDDREGLENLVRKMEEKITWK